MPVKATPKKIEPEPPESSPGAVIKPRASVRPGPYSYFFDVDNDGVATVTIQRKRSRPTGKTDDDGNPIMEGYETAHTIKVTPGGTPTKVEDTPASTRVLKMVTRKHAAVLDEDEKVIKEAWEEEVPYERPVPAKRLVKYVDHDVEYEFHPRMFKETIIVKKPTPSVTFNYQLIGLSLKRIPGSDAFKLVTEDGIDLRTTLAAPTGHDAKGQDLEGLRFYYSKTGKLDVIIPAGDWAYPLTIDPSFTFDGTDFVIASAQTEIKTYQQIWGILGSNGTNPRFLGGYTTADSGGVTRHIDLDKVLGTPIDLSDMSDFSLNLKTTNADASWELQIYMNSNGGWSSTDRYKYTKNLTNDVDATYTLSDFTKVTLGTVDDTAIDYIVIACENIDTALAGNVIMQVKDFFFTTPVKTSDFYDTTGRFVLYDENFEGDDGLAIDDYNSDWTIGVGGTSVAEIDDAQSPGGGSTSLLCYRDGANNVTFQLANTSIAADLARFKFHIRAAQTTCSQEFILKQSGASKILTILIGTNIRIYYGNGAGGNNTVNIPYVASTNYEIWYDIDFTNNKYRVWVDGVMYPGSNANAAGFDNFTGDAAATAFDTFNSTLYGGTGSVWLDDFAVYAGFEDFSALTVPHDIDELTESVSPSGTDYGRGTQDGDWATNGVSIAADNTKAVIGTNSIKANDLDYIQLVSYAYDAAIDISSFTNMRFYCFPETGMTTIRIYLYCTTGGSREISITVIPNKWNYVDLDINGAWLGWDETGSFNATIHHQLFIMNFTGATNNLDLWIDGLHFYGDPAAGTEWQENSLDIDANAFDQDGIEFFNLKQIKDTTGGATFAGDAGIEFADIAAAGLVATDAIDITLTGDGVSDKVLWTSVGDTTPTNRWRPQTNGTGILYFTHVWAKHWGNDEWWAHASSEYVDVKLTNANHDFMASGAVFIDMEIDAIRMGWRHVGTIAPIAHNITIKNCTTASVRLEGAKYTIFIDSDFDKTDVVFSASTCWFISINHKLNGEYVLCADSGAAKAYSDIPAVYKPTPNNIFYLQAGTFNCDVGAQVNIIYRLEGAAGTTVVVAADEGLVVLDPDLSGFLGTLTQTHAIRRAIRRHIRPVPIPVTGPVESHNA